MAKCIYLGLFGKSHAEDLIEIAKSVMVEGGQIHIMNQ